MEVEIGATEVCAPWSTKEIHEAQQNDQSISQVMQWKAQVTDDLESKNEGMEIGEMRRYRQLIPQLEIEDGVLYRRVDTGTPDERLVLVVPRKMRGDLLHLAHNVPSSGHMGINRSLQRLQQQYYWPGMASEVQLWITECEECTCKKPIIASQKAPMENIKVGNPMELWAMDVLGPLPVTARGNQYILVMSDHFTKWVEAVPMATSVLKRQPKLL